MTLAVLRCVLVRVAAERYAIPAQAIATVAGDDAEAVGVDGRTALRIGEEVVPVADLSAVVGTPGRPAARGPALVLTGAHGPRAVRVDALLGQRDVTLQDLGVGVGRVPLVAGATLAGDGGVVIVLDAAAVAEEVLGAPATAAPAPEAPGPSGAATILVVDDALIVRELQRSILERAGYDVVTAADGAAALERIAERPPDLVLTDIEMPGMDGFALVETIRRTPGLAALPVVIVTSRTDEADRRRGLEAGADAYLVKQHFESHTLIEAVERVLGEGRSR